MLGPGGAAGCWGHRLGSNPQLQPQHSKGALGTEASSIFIPTWCIWGGGAAPLLTSCPSRLPAFSTVLSPALARPPESPSCPRVFCGLLLSQRRGQPRCSPGMAPLLLSLPPGSCLGSPHPACPWEHCPWKPSLTFSWLAAPLSLGLPSELWEGLKHRGRRGMVGIRPLLGAQGLAQAGTVTPRGAHWMDG